MARPCDGRILRARPSLDDDAVKNVKQSVLSARSLARSC